MDPLTWASPSGNGKSRQHKTLTDATLQRLREDIVLGNLKPGMKIKSEDLKKRYEVGTSPVREALFQLVSEGLVKAEGQRGFRVAEINEPELVDITDWRVRMECEALRRSIGNGDVEWEANTLAAFHRLKHGQADGQNNTTYASAVWEENHKDFHFNLYSACRSPWLLRFCELLIQHGERYRRAFVIYSDIPQGITEEHQALLELALERDTERAVKLLEDHIRHAFELARFHLRKLAQQKEE